MVDDKVLVCKFWFHTLDKTLRIDGVLEVAIDG